MRCHGNGEGHCCNLGRHGVCTFLDDRGTDAPRRWVCRLREELGSWDEVHTDERYLATVYPKLREIGVREHCGDWPDAHRRATARSISLCCYGLYPEVTDGDVQ